MGYDSLAHTATCCWKWVTLAACPRGAQQCPSTGDRHSRTQRKGALLWAATYFLPSRVKTAQDSVQDADLGLSFASCLLGHPEQITSPFRASVVCTYKWSSLPLPITVELHEVLSVTMLSRLSGTKHAASPSPPYHHRSNRTFIDSLPKAKHTTRQLGRKKNVLQTADDAAAGGIRKASLRRCRCMVG